MRIEVELRGGERTWRKIEGTTDKQLAQALAPLR